MCEGKKVVFGILMIAIMISGCSRKNSDLGESEKKYTHSRTSPTTKIPSVTPAVSPATAIPSEESTMDNNEREDTSVEYAEANYFGQKVKNILYYRDGKKYTILPDTEEGKQIILMVKQRYVNTGEHVLKENKLKKTVPTLKEKGKALEIEFAKQCDKTYTGRRSNNYKKVIMHYRSWFYPLEGEAAKYFIPMPNRECTYGKLGDAKQLLGYLEEYVEEL